MYSTAHMTVDGCTATVLHSFHVVMTDNVVSVSVGLLVVVRNTRDHFLMLLYSNGYF